MAGARSRSVWLAIGAFLIAKFKWVIALLKWSKFGGTLISMLASLGTYAFVYGWRFAVVIVYLIFVHEMGHVLAARRKGIRTSPAFFIPFVGAFISMKDQPRSAADEAYLAYGGPLAGLVSFLPAVPLYLFTNDPIWALVIFVGAMLNLFNLLPVSPLDGGRIVSVLSTKVWIAGLALLLVFVVFSPSPLLFLIFLLGLFSWWTRAREGYRHKVLSHERTKLAELRRSLREWPYLYSTIGLKNELNHAIAEAERIEASRKRWYIPFVQDEERLVQERARIDRYYAERTMTLLKEWEYEPARFEDNDAGTPAPSLLLARADREAAEHEERIDTELERLRTYYEAPASVKWKVLAAYLGLAVVLSAFLFYGHQEMTVHESTILSR